MGVLVDESLGLVTIKGHLFVEFLCYFSLDLSDLARNLILAAL